MPNRVAEDTRATATRNPLWTTSSPRNRGPTGRFSAHVPPRGLRSDRGARCTWRRARRGDRTSLSRPKQSAVEAETAYELLEYWENKRLEPKC